MSKKLIAGAGIVAALGVIALPLGAFATDSTSWTETVKVNVNTACTIKVGTTSASGAASNVEINLGDVANGTAVQASKLSAPVNKTYYAVCNNAGGFTVNATSDTKMTDGTHEIATGTDTTGADAKWAFRIDENTNVLSTSYGATNTYYEIPTSATVLTASGATDSTSGKWSTDYQVYVGTATPAGSYSGSVTYTLTYTES